MKEATKNLLYTVLDIIEVISNDKFSSIDKNDYLIARNELINLIHPTNSNIYKINNSEEDVITELIGILPSLLIDKKKFPANKDLVRFSESSFNIIVPSWEKKKREEIIGRIVYMIAEKSPLELQKFTDVWKEFNDNVKKTSNSKDKTNYVDTWLSFFENYNNKK